MANMRTIYHPSHVSGGIDDTYLDYADGNSLSDKDRAFAIVAGVLYLYELNATSGAAESIPSIIAPDTNAGTKRWILIVAVSTAFNADFIPVTDNTYNIGDATHHVANIYA